MPPDRMGDLRGVDDGKKTIIWWLFNVFFPYQKWLIVCVIALLVTAGTFIYDLVTTPKPDGTVLILSGATLSDEKVMSLGKRFGYAASDINGDGKSRYDCQVIYPDGGPYETARFEILLSDRYTRLCFLDEETLPYIDARAEEGYWADLTEYQLDTIPGKPYLADLSGSKALSQLGSDSSIQYAVIQVTPRDATEEILNAQDAALQCIREVILW